MKNNDKFDATNLRMLMEKSGVTEPQLSEATGIAIATLRVYLNHKTYNPSLNSVLALADFFAVPMDYLVNRCDEETAREITANYDKAFMKLRRGSYEAYLVGRKRMKYADDFVEAPWPYNLLDDIFGKADPWVEVITPDQEKGLYLALDSLSAREKDCVLAYYKEGLSSGKIASSYNLTRARICQILKRSLRLLRHPSRAKMIRLGPELLKLQSKLEQQRRSLMLDQLALDKWEEDLAYRKEFLMQESERVESAIKSKYTEAQTLSIEEMNLSVRSFNCLWHANCRMLGDVVSIIQKGELLHVRNLGKKCAEEILREVKRLTGVRYELQ